MQRPQGKNEVSGFKMEQGGQCGRSVVIKERRADEDGGRSRTDQVALRWARSPVVVLLRSHSHNTQLTIL